MLTPTPDIGPISGAQPGSDAWTDDMPHDAWRQLTAFFIRRWKQLPFSSSSGAEDPAELSVFVSYRTQPKNAIAVDDRVGRPDHSDRAQDLVAVDITLEGLQRKEDRIEDYVFLLAIDRAGDGEKADRQEREVPLDLSAGYQYFSLPFAPGKVSWQVVDRQGRELLRGSGKDISEGKGERLYNFNAWTASQSITL